jgi:hypothetical protein
MSVLDSLISYARDSFASYKDEEEVSIEAEVLMSIIKCRGHVRDGRVSTQVVTLEYNMDRPQSEALKSIAIGRVIKRLGFRSKRTAEGLSGFVYDAKVIDRLRKRYNVVESKQGKIA